MALKPNRSERWSKRRKDTSTASTERWPTPSGPPAAATSEAERKRRATVWRNVAYLTSLGWMIVLPIAGGVILGRVIDNALGSQPYATMILFSVGGLIAIFQTGNVLSRAMKVIRRE